MSGSILKCYKKALYLVDAFEYEPAIKFLIKGQGLGLLFDLETNPHLPSLQLFASISLELGDVPSAIRAYDLAIKSFPHDSHNYALLAPLVDPLDSIDLFNTALTLIEERRQNMIYDDDQIPTNSSSALDRPNMACGETLTTFTDHSPNAPLNPSQIHCALAELWITDLCQESEADDKAYYHLENAESNANSPVLFIEIYYLRAQLAINRSQRDEAITWFKRAIDFLPQLLNLNRSVFFNLNDPIESKEFSPIEEKFHPDCEFSSSLNSGQFSKEISIEDTISFDIIFQIAKLELEFAFYSISIRLLQWCLEIQEDNPDLHYLLGLSLIHQIKSDHLYSDNPSSIINHINSTGHIQEFDMCKEESKEHMDNAREHLLIARKLILKIINESNLDKEDNFENDEDMLSHIDSLLLEYCGLSTTDGKLIIPNGISDKLENVK